MEDLSPADPISALTPTGQGSPGSVHSSREAAMTAPGTLPALSDAEPDRPGPRVEMIDLGDSGRHLVDGEGS